MPDLALMPNANSNAQVTRFIPRSELDIAEKQKNDAIQASIVSLKLENDLSSEIIRKWNRAKTAKLKIEQVMLNSLRAIDGEYSPDKLAALQAAGSPEIFRMLTTQKCRELKTKILEIYLFSGKETWTASPSPIPDLPPTIIDKIKETASRIIFNAVDVYQQQMGIPVFNDDFQNTLGDYQAELRHEVELKIEEEAEISAMKMTRKIKDQLLDCKWEATFKEIIDDFVKYPACFIESPRIIKRKVSAWIVVNGRYEMSVKDVTSIDIRRISPFDVYPEPDSTGINNGYLFIKERISTSELAEFIGVPGWDDIAIRKILNIYSKGGIRDWSSIDAERAKLENKTDISVIESDKLEVLRFFGNIKGDLLLEQGMSEDDIPDDDKEYPVEIWTINGEKIKAILNFNKLGKKPIVMTSWEPQTGAFWGKGPPEMIADIQEECNSYKRILVYNSAMASGPLQEINIDRLEIGEDCETRPWKKYLVNSKQMLEAPAVRFTNVPLVVKEILILYERAKAEADEVLGILSFPGAKLGRAAETSSGLSMVMTDSAKGIKYSASNIDDLVSNVIKGIYNFNMIYDSDELIKGDLVIDVNGVGSVIAKEQLAIRRNEFLNTVLQNPLAVKVIGLQTTKKVLSEQARTLDMQAIADMIEEYEIQETNPLDEQTRGGSARSAQTLDVSGLPAGGKNTNLFSGARA
ncbi:MAG: hypothetical protein NUV76_12270 [Candidatus Kuenenia sp.]|nr:hypothetical protein [Candidatus Kuenenia sp.]